jgi:hypothetical protein
MKHLLLFTVVFTLILTGCKDYKYLKTCSEPKFFYHEMVEYTPETFYSLVCKTHKGVVYGTDCSNGIRGYYLVVQEPGCPGEYSEESYLRKLK